MAHNRMQVYCKACGGAFAIAKYYPHFWYTANKSDALDDFFEEHMGKCITKADGEIDEDGGTGMFGFRTENDADGLWTAFSPYRVFRKD